MTISTMIASWVLSATMLAGATEASARSSSACRSTWVKSTSVVRRFFTPVSKVVCNKLNPNDEEQAKTCIDDANAFADDVARMEREWNRGEHGSWKIGPRALPLNSQQAGTVSTERQFVASPVVNRRYTIELERTGGNAKKDLQVKICFVDPNGSDVRVENVNLSRDGKKAYKQTFSSVEGTFPLIHLNNQRWGANGHKYTIKVKASGEPTKVTRARKTLTLSRVR